MASILTMGGTLRHLRELFDEGTTLGLGDGQLLSRYAEGRDESAFAALVARHGPMVLSTCRAVLRHEHDVEDAFQATFLVLARKANSLRAGDALGGWLHRVAFRIAVEAASEARRRRRREAEASAMIPLRTIPEIPEPDVAAIVHEEVDRLPEKHRLPVVLCDLEGLTYEQAAGRLRWTVPTLRCRLAKARRELQGRLARRGLTAGALAVVLAAPMSGAQAAVPSAMARAAVLAATTGTASAGASALSASLIRSMVLAKLKVAAAVLAASAAMIAIGVGSWRPLRSGPAPAMVPQAVAEAKRPDPPKEAPAEMIEVRGRVVDPDGKPVAGAVVRAAYLEWWLDPAPETTSGADGRFAMQVPPNRYNSEEQAADAMFPSVIATAPGFGPAWVSAIRAPGEATIRLAAAGPPIEGRILDLEGRPVVGARVRLERIWIDREGGLSAWLDRARDFGTHGPSNELLQVPVTLETATDPDGRFRLSGIGRDRLAEVLVSGPTIATAQLYVTDRDGAPIRAADRFAMKPSWITFHPRRFVHTVEPTRPIEGFLRDKDTGRPLAGFRIRGMVFDEGSLVRAVGVEAKTDDRGHYRLTGLPVAPSYRLFLEPPAGLPYMKATFRTPDGSMARGPIAFDLALKRGVLVRGRVTDKKTGRPVTGHVSAFAFVDNPHVDEFPEYRSGYEGNSPIRDDGRYEVVTIPGRGFLACRSDVGRYRGGVGAAAIRGFNPRMSSLGMIPALPSGCLVVNYHVLAEVDAVPGPDPTTLDLQVDPGRSVTIRVEDPEGRPLGGTKAMGLTDLLWTLAYEQDAPTIEVHGLDPSRPRRVTIVHEGRKLAGSVYLKGGEASPMTLRLRPWGVVTGRVVDDEGQPLGGASLYNLFGLDPKPSADQDLLPDRRPAPVVGRDGRFRIEGLVPGLKYGVSAVQPNRGSGDLFRDVTVAPGEVKDLGDINAVPRKRGN